jgi:hypothetical protein
MRGPAAVTLQETTANLEPLFQKSPTQKYRGVDTKKIAFEIVWSSPSTDGRKAGRVCEIPLVPRSSKERAPSGLLVEPSLPAWTNSSDDRQNQKSSGH